MHHEQARPAWKPEGVAVLQSFQRSILLHFNAVFFPLRKDGKWHTIILRTSYIFTASSLQQYLVEISTKCNCIVCTLCFMSHIVNMTTSGFHYCRSTICSVLFPENILLLVLYGGANLWRKEAMLLLRLTFSGYRIYSLLIQRVCLVDLVVGWRDVDARTPTPSNSNSSSYCTKRLPAPTLRTMTFTRCRLIEQVAAFVPSSLARHRLDPATTTAATNRHHHININLGRRPPPPPRTTSSSAAASPTPSEGNASGAENDGDGDGGSIRHNDSPPADTAKAPEAAAAAAIEVPSYRRLYDSAMHLLESELSLEPYPIPDGLEGNTAVVGKGLRQQVKQIQHYVAGTIYIYIM